MYTFIKSLKWKDYVLSVMALLMLCAAYTTVLIVRRQSQLAAVSRYNLTWIAGQAGIEVSRLYGTIAESLLDKNEIDDDELDLRLSIVENRVQVMHGEDITEFIAGNDDLTKIVVNFGIIVAKARQELGDAPNFHRSIRLMQLTKILITPIAHLAAAANEYSANMEAEDSRKLSQLFWLFATILVIITAFGLALVAAMTWHNRLLVRAQAQAERQNAALQAHDLALQANTQQFDAALNNMSQALCMIDVHGIMTVCNVQFKDLFGLADGMPCVGHQVNEVFIKIENQNIYQPAMIRSLFRKQSQLAIGRMSTSFTEEDETGRAIAVSQEPMLDGGYVCTFEDITERRRIDAQIRHMAHHDALTGLPNRVWFHSQLGSALARHDSDGEVVSLLYLDLDQFKQVNDVYGHSFGDQLLKIVSVRLKGCLRNDCDVIARLGGDEFAVLQTGYFKNGGPAASAKRVVQSLSLPFEIEGQIITIGVSVGIAVACGPNVEADALLKEADIALYRAKSNGRGTFCLYEAAMGSALRERRQMEIDLGHACASGELQIYYQPLYALASNEVCGFEALLRWIHPKYGIVSPAVFIPIAEESGLINDIGQWVLERACSDAAIWPGGLKVAVNLSPTQICSPGLVKMVERTLAQSGLASSRLELEITESALLQSSHPVLATLQDLASLGLHLVLDDFGTGYSSLSYLHSFPFRKVKIDRSFVQHMLSQPHSGAIINAIISLAACLGMTTTAEGVETRAQLEQLRAAGCTEIQGFLIARPHPLHMIQHWLTVGKRKPSLQLTNSDIRIAK